MPAVPAGRLFDALVDAESLTKWWAQEATTEPQPGGTYHLSWPAIGRDLRGVYVGYEPPTRLAMTWRWDQEPDLPERRVVFTVRERAGGSRLRVEHGTYGEGPAEAEDRQGHIDGWLHFLDRLRALMVDDEPFGGPGS